MNREGQTVAFLYRGSLPDGTVFDEGKGVPHSIVLGHGNVMRTLEEALGDMSLGEERTVEIAAADAYGEYDKNAVQRVPLYKIPDGSNLPVGEIIAWKTPLREEPIPARVTSIENQVATLDFNHPLAGKDIVYWVKVIGIKEALPQDRR